MRDRVFVTYRYEGGLHTALVRIGSDAKPSTEVVLFSTRDREEFRQRYEKIHLTHAILLWRRED